jgi:hypothetical protein
MRALGEPFFEAAGFVVESLGTGEADKLEAQALGFGADEVAVSLGVWHGTNVGRSFGFKF